MDRRGFLKTCLGGAAGALGLVAAKRETFDGLPVHTEPITEWNPVLQQEGLVGYRTWLAPGDRIMGSDNKDYSGSVCLYRNAGDAMRYVAILTAYRYMWIES